MKMRHDTEIVELEVNAQGERTFGERCGDIVSKYAGTLSFLVIHAVWFTVWCLLNSGWFGKGVAFDPYPYPFLTFVVSLESIFLSLFILMSQNRANRMADRRAQLDLEINLLAERESTLTLRMIRAISAKLEIPETETEEIEKLATRTEPKDLMEKLSRAIPDV